MKKIKFICMALLLIITCVFNVYEIGRIQNSSFEKNENRTEKVCSVVSINIDMQSEPICVGREFEVESHQVSLLSMSYLNLLLWMQVFAPIILFLLFYQDVVHDDYMAFKREILNYMHAKDGRKKCNTIPDD